MPVILVPFHLDEPLPDVVPPVPVDVVIAPDLPPGTPWERMSVLYAAVSDTVAADLADGRRPVVVSGDCTTSLGIVAGIQRSGLDPSLASGAVRAVLAGSRVVAVSVACTWHPGHGEETGPLIDTLLA